MQYTREDLISICEKAIVPVSNWGNRDTPQSQLGVGQLWALLKAGCEFTVVYSEGEYINTDSRMIWVRVLHPTFSSFEIGSGADYNEELYYIPTAARIEACCGQDWY